MVTAGQHFMSDFTGLQSVEPIRSKGSSLRMATHQEPVCGMFSRRHVSLYRQWLLNIFPTGLSVTSARGASFTQASHEESACSSRKSWCSQATLNFNSMTFLAAKSMCWAPFRNTERNKGSEYRYERTTEDSYPSPPYTTVVQYLLYTIVAKDTAT